MAVAGGRFRRAWERLLARGDAEAAVPLGQPAAEPVVAARPSPRAGPRLRPRGDRGAAVRVGVPAAVGVVALGAALLAAVLAGPVWGRALSTVDPAVPGGRGGVDEWVLAVRVIADHPLAGVGPEGYRIVAPARIDPGYARRHGREVVVDRAHDGPLDVAATAGVSAALAYVALLAAVAGRAVVVIRRGRDPVVVGAAVGVVAWLGQQLVSFPIAEVDPAAWLLAGLVVVAAPHTAPTATSRPQRGRHLAAGALAGVLAVAGVTAVAADRDLGRAERAAAAGAQPVAVAAADQATALRPDDVDGWYLAARLAAQGPSLLAVDAGLDRVESGLRHSPGDPALLDLEEALLVERATRSGLPADLAVADAASRARIASDPTGPDHRRRLALVERMADR
jgi:hypothetical protein